MFKITPEQIDDIVTAHKELQDVFDAAIKVGCIDINGELFEKTWHLYSETSKHIDPEGWLDWYIYDNDYGKNGYDCTVNGEAIVVTNTTQLADIMNRCYK